MGQLTDQKAGFEERLAFVEKALAESLRRERAKAYPAKGPLPELERRAFAKLRPGDGLILASFGGVGIISEEVGCKSEDELRSDLTPRFADFYSLQEMEEAVESAFDSLAHSAEMMKEIVEETRRDQIEFEIRSRQIDRTLARTREILDELISEPR